MSKKIETGDFQALTEQESLAVNGGAGIATTWIELGRDITLRAISAVQNFFSTLSIPGLASGFGTLGSFIGGIFNDLIGSLGSRGL